MRKCRGARANADAHNDTKLSNILRRSWLRSLPLAIFSSYFCFPFLPPRWQSLVLVFAFVLSLFVFSSLFSVVLTDKAIEGE